MKVRRRDARARRDPRHEAAGLGDDDVHRGRTKRVEADVLEANRAPSSVNTTSAHSASLASTRTPQPHRRPESRLQIGSQHLCRRARALARRQIRTRRATATTHKAPGTTAPTGTRGTACAHHRPLAPPPPDDPPPKLLDERLNSTGTELEPPELDWSPIVQPPRRPPPPLPPAIAKRIAPRRARAEPIAQDRTSRAPTGTA